MFNAVVWTLVLLLPINNICILIYRPRSVLRLGLGTHDKRVDELVCSVYFYYSIRQC